MHDGQSSTISKSKSDPLVAPHPGDLLQVSWLLAAVRLLLNAGLHLIYNELCKPSQLLLRCWRCGEWGLHLPKDPFLWMSCC